MVTSYDTILNCFKEHGDKLTRPRKLVAQVISQARAPLSAYDIRDQIVEQGDHIDVVSVYRILAILEKYNLITRVPSTNQVFRTETEHCCSHPVFICNSCGTAQELPWHGAKNLMQEVAAASNLQIDALSLELRGQCSTCVA